MKSKRGFTIIELVVVISIVAILSLVLVPQVTGYIDNANEVVCISNQKQLVNEITRGYVNGTIDVNDLSENHGKSIKKITEMLNFDISSLEDSYLLNYENEIIDVICLEHQNKSAHNQEAVEDIQETTPVKSDGVISLTDNEGNVYDIISELAFDYIIDNITSSGQQLAKGDTITDGNKTYAVSNDAYMHIPSNDNYTIEEFASYNGLIEINNDSKIYTNNDIVSNQYGNKTWSETMNKGSIVYNDGKYYIAAGDIRIWDSLSNGKFSNNGQFIELNLAENILNN